MDLADDNFLMFLCLVLFNYLTDDVVRTEDETPFSYLEDTGTGPESWGLINPDWQVCDNGAMQSPIDLLDARVQVLPNLGKLKRDYKPAHATVKNRGHDITVC